MKNQINHLALDITLRDVLSFPSFEGSCIVAGKNRLDHPVWGLNQLDAPDLTNWARVNELIITTGFVVKDDPKSLVEIIHRASDLGLAGICIKPKRFLSGIPDIVIQEAVELSFPLVELPEDVQFHNLIADFYRNALERQNSKLFKSNQLISLLLRMMIRGVSLKDIADRITLLLNNSVVILDTLNRRTVMSTQSHEMISDDNCDVVLAKLRSTFGAAMKTKQLLVDNRSLGEICIIPTNRPILQGDLVIVDELILPIALEISREYLVREIENSHFNDYIDHLFNDEITDLDHEQMRASNLNLEPDAHYQVCCFKLASEEKVIASNATVMKNASFFSEFKYLLRQQGFTARIARLGGHYALIIKGKEALRNASTTSDAAIEKSVKQMGISYPHDELIIGCGRSYQGLEGMIHSQKEAVSAMRMSEMMESPRNVVFYKNLGLLRILTAQNPSADALQLVKESLGKLLDYNPNHREELLLTLRSYFSCHGNVKKISEKLYTHYNTIVYRIKRIEELTGMQLDDENDRFTLEAALRIYDFFDQ